MKTIIIMFIIIGVIISMSTIGYVIYDYIKEKKIDTATEKANQ